MTRNNKVELIHIWQPVKTGGQAFKADGTQMEQVAILLNGRPYYLKKDFALEKGFITKEEAKQFYDNK